MSSIELAVRSISRSAMPVPENVAWNHHTAHACKARRACLSPFIENRANGRNGWYCLGVASTNGILLFDGDILSLNSAAATRNVRNCTYQPYWRPQDSVGRSGTPGPAVC